MYKVVLLNQFQVTYCVISLFVISLSVNLSVDV